MTNLEWLFENNREFVKDCMSSKENIAVSKETLEIKSCYGMLCKNCLFTSNSESCIKVRERWLDEEYVEPEGKR